MNHLSVMCALLLVSGGPALAQTFQRDLQRSHIEGNVPATHDFHGVLQRDLDAYFSNWLKKPLRVEYQLLRDAPTQSGLSYPKYFAWVRMFAGKDLEDEGAVVLAAMNKREFRVVDYTSAVTIRSSPDVVNHTYPAPLVSTIVARAGKRS